MRRAHRIFPILTFATLVATLSGCSVGMAASGKPAPDLSAVRVSADRSDIELRLGAPVRTGTDGEGRNVAVYRYEIGNEPSAGRAIGHGVMDVLTLGLWEVVGTPVEVFQGERYELTVVYDENGKASQIGTTKIGS
jgi:hypothetical protein